VSEFKCRRLLLSEANGHCSLLGPSEFKYFASFNQQIIGDASATFTDGTQDKTALLGVLATRSITSIRH
jgi:hypothetical protein